MIKIIKLGDLIYENVEPKVIDENGDEIWNIPKDYNSLKQAAKDTLGWLVFSGIQKSINRSFDKLYASVFKAICLLAKVINTLNPDLNQLAEREQLIFSKLVSLAENNYTNSELLNLILDKLQFWLDWYGSKIQELDSLTTTEELISFLENLTV